MKATAPFLLLLLVIECTLVKSLDSSNVNSKDIHLSTNEQVSKVWQFCSLSGGVITLEKFVI